MTNEQIVAFRKEFFYQIDKKPSHGAASIKEIYIISLNNVLLGNTEYNKSQVKI